MSATGRSMKPRVTVFLCGESHRGDDGVAFRAAPLLAPEAQAGYRAEAVGRLDAQHFLDLAPGAQCIVVDAVAGITPGEILVMPLDRLTTLAEARSDDRSVSHRRSSHGTSVEDAVALARMLRPDSARGTFVGVGTERFDLGADLSPPVAAALPALAQTLAQEIDRLALGEAG